MFFQLLYHHAFETICVIQTPGEKLTLCIKNSQRNTTTTTNNNNVAN